MKSDVNFIVLNWSKWDSILSVRDVVPINDIASLIVSNEDIWAVLTYLRLRKHGLEVSIGPRPLPGAINIGDGIHIQPDHVTADMYVVGCRGDGHYPAICQTVIQQNTLRIAGEAAIYIPQWAQPALLPRDVSRTGIRNVGFFGHAAVNLMKCFHQKTFLKELRARGYDLLIKDRSERVSWSDYRDIDVLLSVRSIPYKHLRLKPANKLINAWLAGTPAIIGPEPGIHALGISELDYLEACDPHGVLKALELLRARPLLYEAMVTHGRQRAAHYSDAAIAARWNSGLRAIRADFRRWQQMSRSQRNRNYLRRVRKLRTALGKHDRDIHRAYREMGFEREWWKQTRPPNI